MSELRSSESLRKELSRRGGELEALILPPPSLLARAEQSVFFMVWTFWTYRVDSYLDYPVGTLRVAVGHPLGPPLILVLSLVDCVRAARWSCESSRFWPHALNRRM